MATYFSSLEFYKMASNASYQPFRSLGIVASLALVTLAFFRLEFSWGIISLAFILMAIWSVKQSPPANISLGNWTTTIVGILYTGGLLQFAIRLRDLTDGFIWGVVVLLGTWTMDTCAYLIGRQFGKYQFVPKLSPKKTWEGTIGGFICSFIIVLSVSIILDISIHHAIGLGIIIPVSVILGDLTESFLKRTAGVKDSGALLPGHGGLLDRIDGLVFAVAATYHYIILAVRLI